MFSTTMVAPIDFTALSNSLAEWIAPDFSIDGFWTYIGAAIVVWVVNFVLHGVFGNLREKDSGLARMA